MSSECNFAVQEPQESLKTGISIHPFPKELLRNPSSQMCTHPACDWFLILAKKMECGKKEALCDFRIRAVEPGQAA